MKVKSGLVSLLAAGLVSVAVAAPANAALPSLYGSDGASWAQANYRATALDDTAYRIRGTVDDTATDGWCVELRGVSSQGTAIPIAGTRSCGDPVTYSQLIGQGTTAIRVYQVSNTNPRNFGNYSTLRP